MEEPSLPPPAPLPPPDSPESRYGWAHPWIVADAAAWLEDFIRPNHRVFEWGSGGSTTWFAARAAEIITVEHDHAWASVLRSLGLPNVTVLERPDDYPAFSQYAGAIIGEGMFDIILIDGADGYDLGMVGSRFACAALASQHIAAGGVIVLDNAGGDRKLYG